MTPHIEDYENRLHNPVIDVMKAALFAEAKYGQLTDDPVRAAGILTREVGESWDEALELTKIGTGQPGYEGRAMKLYNELAQVAATALLMMENLQKEEWGRGVI